MIQPTQEARRSESEMKKMPPNYHNSIETGIYSDNIGTQNKSVSIKKHNMTKQITKLKQ